MKHLGNPLLGGVPKAGRVLPDIGTEKEKNIRPENGSAKNRNISSLLMDEM